MWLQPLAVMLLLGSLNQAKLERMMTSYNRIHDTILNSSKPILDTKTPGHQDTRTPPNHGKHQKTLSILSDEDISVHIRECFTTAPIELQNPEQLTNWLAEQYYTTLLLKGNGNDGKTHVSLCTIRNWMNTLGYKYGMCKTGVYIDGHEQDDVVT